MLPEAAPFSSINPLCQQHCAPINNDDVQKPGNTSTLADTGDITCPCEDCNLLFETELDTMEHKVNHPRPVVTQAGYKCEQIDPRTGIPCNRSFGRPYELTRHKEDIHGKLKFRCALCVKKKMYSRKDNLKRHWQKAHPQVSFSGVTPTTEEVPMPPPIPPPAGNIDPLFWPLCYNYTFCNDPSCDIPATDCYLYRTQGLYGSNSIEPPNYLPSHSSCGTHPVNNPTQQVVPLSIGDPSSVRAVAVRPKPQCWEHGCNGRQFSTSSNLQRHQRQKSGNAVRHECPKCGASFTRKMARNDHRDGGKCKQPARRSRSGE